MTTVVIANSGAPVGIVLIDPTTGLPYSAAGGGVAISAGTNSFSSGTVVLSNSNGITFGMAANGVITATVTPGAAAGIAAVQLPNTTYTSGTVSFINSNGLSFGSSGAGGVTGSYTVPAATVFSNSNNVSFGLAGSTITATATFAGGAGGAAISAGAASQNTGTVIFSNSNGVSFGLNAGTLTGSVAAQTNQTLGNYAVGNTTGQSSSSTIDARSLSFSGAGAVSVGLSGGQVVISAAAGAQSAQTLGIYASSQTTGQSSSSTLDARSFTVVGAGVVSVGLSAGSLLISGPGTTGLTQISVGMSTGGNTVGTTGMASQQLVLAGGNNVTLSGSTSSGSMTITISAPNAQTGISGLQVSNTTYTSGTITFQNANGISFGSSGANGISASYTVPTQTNQTLGWFGVGNTTQNSSTTLDARTLSLDGLGAMTVGFSNGSIQLSAPATSSLVGTGQVSVATNGSTISVGAASYGTLSYWDNGFQNGSIALAQVGLGSVAVQAIVMPANLSMSALREFVQGTFSSSSNSSYANTISVQAGLYTLNGSTLSLASSGSQSYAFTNTSNNSISVLSGLKGLTIPLNASLTPGVYWLGLWSSTASANANWMTLANAVNFENQFTYNGLFGSSTVASNQVVLGAGVWSTTSANLPASIGLSQITGSSGNFAALVNLYNLSA